MSTRSDGLFMDLFMRDTFSDTGVEPVTDAYVSMSPDIIPYAQDTLTAEYLVSHYGPPLLNKQLEYNNNNNIYVRAKNNYAGATSGQIHLYYATANLLVNVSAWKANQVQNSNGELFARVSATTQGQVVAGDQPFFFNPPEGLFRHFCFLGILSTTMHPFSPPANNFATWDAFVNWVRDHANVVWHNANIVSILPAQGFSNDLAFHNIDTSNDQFFGFTCDYTNLPAGSILRVYTNPNPSVNFTGFNVQETINNVNGHIGGGAIFPANYETTVFTTCQFPGNPTTPPPGVSIRTGSLGYQPTAADPASLDRFPDAMVAPEAVGIQPEAFGLVAGGQFVQIMSFTSIFGH